MARNRINRFTSRPETPLNRDCSDEEWDNRWSSIDWNNYPEHDEVRKQKEAERAKFKELAKKSEKYTGIRVVIK